MSHPYDRLNIPGIAGTLIFTPCPGTRGSSLDEALGTLQQAGATVLVSLMPSSELAINAVEGLGARCQALGLAWYHLPVADEQVPQADFAQGWEQARQALVERLRAGETLAIHCKGGSGRTGLIAARILIEAGIPRSEAIAQVRALRPKALQHPAHLDWIAQFDANH